ncbi:hypothetical protein ACRQ1B_23300 [Rhizobium panacihumi]|uniref:hypothetical protein n=1 Tax=Rhizobium panacihumi TaxID=2008450 RepID=UPI003D7905E0
MRVLAGLKHIGQPGIFAIIQEDFRRAGTPARLEGERGRAACRIFEFGGESLSAFAGECQHDRPFVFLRPDACQSFGPTDSLEIVPWKTTTACPKR